ncbi:hypothetical protein [Hominenteromicrobium sp.]|uniref:hypothetical protein n=1 Tax=Hominenteromicrobium sp. TaxID=3073581 RepID=UPI003AAF09AA
MRCLDKRVERICDELYRLRIVQRMEWTERGPVRATLEIERKSAVRSSARKFTSTPRARASTLRRRSTGKSTSTS